MLQNSAFAEPHRWALARIRDRLWCCTMRLIQATTLIPKLRLRQEEVNVERVAAISQGGDDGT
jgi:hypothetical protein